MFSIGKWSKALKNDQDGFTLVELMVVVVIIGVLVAIAIPIYNTVTDGAERGAMEANLRTIDGAIMQLKAVGTEDLDNIDDWDAEMKEFIEDWDNLGPGEYDVEDVSGHGYKGVVKITDGAGGYDNDDEYILVGGELTTKP